MIHLFAERAWLPHVRFMAALDILRAVFRARMKYGSLVVFIRNDSAEIWGFGYGLTPVTGTLRIMARTGVLVRVVCALKRSI